MQAAFQMCLLLCLAAVVSGQTIENGAAPSAGGNSKSAFGAGREPETKRPPQEKSPESPPPQEKSPESPPLQEKSPESPPLQEKSPESPPLQEPKSGPEKDTEMNELNPVSPVEAERPAEQNEDLPTMLRQASIANRRSEFKESIALCDQILKELPNNMSALATRGVALVSIKKYKEGVADLSRVIDSFKNPNMHAIYGSRALAYLQLDEYEKAIADCDTAIKAQAKEQGYWLIRGVANQRAKNYQRAVADLNRGLAIDQEGPNVPVFLSARADLYSAMDRDSESLKDLNKVLKLTPKDPQAYMNRALLYIKFKDWEKVLADLDSVIDFAPMGKLSNEALKLRAEANKKCGKYKESIEDFSSLLAGYPKEPSFLMGRAEARFAVLEYEAALKDINKCIISAPKEPRCFELRAKIYDALKNPDAAEKDRKQALELQAR